MAKYWRAACRGGFNASRNVAHSVSQLRVDLLDMSAIQPYRGQDIRQHCRRDLETEHRRIFVVAP